MAVNLNPQIKLSNTAPKQTDAAVEPTKVTTENPVPPAPAVQPVKQPLIKRIASGAAYGWINLSESVKGVVEGLVLGTLLGTAIAGYDLMTSGVKKAWNTKSKFTSFKEMVTSPRKYLGRTGKIYAPIAALAMFCGYMLKAKLTINQRTANVDHALYTGHREPAVAIK